VADEGKPARAGRIDPDHAGDLERGQPDELVDDVPVDARLSVVARPGHELVPLTRQVRSAVASAIERLVGLEVGEIVVIVDGVGG